MTGYRFIFGEPEEGQLTLGVVYHIVRQREIYEATGLEPTGYVVDAVENELGEDSEGDV